MLVTGLLYQAAVCGKSTTVFQIHMDNITIRVLLML